MEGIRKLRAEFLKQIGLDGPPAFFDAEVLDVDDSDFTCTIMLDEVELPEVRLRAVVSTNHSIDILPEVGAAVVVGKLADDDYIVIACDKISQYQVITGLTVFKLDSNGILISKGAETLNKILTDVVNGILTIAAPKDVPGITALLIRINDLLK